MANKDILCTALSCRCVCCVSEATVQSRPVSLELPFSSVWRALQWVSSGRRLTLLVRTRFSATASCTALKARALKTTTDNRSTSRPLPTRLLANWSRRRHIDLRSPPTTRPARESGQSGPNLSAHMPVINCVFSQSYDLVFRKHHVCFFYLFVTVGCQQWRCLSGCKNRFPIFHCFFENFSKANRET